MPVTAKNQHRIEATKSITQAKPITSNVGIATAAMTEEERIAAMFDQGGEQWEQTQQQMAKLVLRFMTVRSRADRTLARKPYTDRDRRCRSFRTSLYLLDTLVTAVEKRVSHLQRLLDALLLTDHRALDTGMPDEQ